MNCICGELPYVHKPDLTIYTGDELLLSRLHGGCAVVGGDLYSQKAPIPTLVFFLHVLVILSRTLIFVLQKDLYDAYSI